MHPEGAAGRILVLEDPTIRSLVQSVLSRHGYTVEQADVAHGVAMLQNRAAKPDLVITNAPDAMEPFAPDLAVLYVSSYPDPRAMAPFRRASVLKKPFHADELLEAVRLLTAAEKCPQ
jgi:hypothetical protein